MTGHKDKGCRSKGSCTRRCRHGSYRWRREREDSRARGRQEACYPFSQGVGRTRDDFDLGTEGKRWTKGRRMTKKELAVFMLFT